TPKPLLGTARAPGFFKGSTQVVKDAAKLCTERAWVEPTGEWIGTGRSKKEKFRLTASGLHAALQHSPTLHLLQSLQAAVRRQVEVMSAQQQAIAEFGRQITPLQDALAVLASRVEPPNLDEIVRRLTEDGSPPTPPEPSPIPPAGGVPRW